MKPQWIVNVKGKANSGSFEVSVVRSGNVHGALSYGWFGEDKLLISHNGGPCRWPLVPLVWDKMIDVAKEVALELNGADCGDVTSEKGIGNGYSR